MFEMLATLTAHILGSYFHWNYSFTQFFPRTLFEIVSGASKNTPLKTWKKKLDTNVQKVRFQNFPLCVFANRKPKLTCKKSETIKYVEHPSSYCKKTMSTRAYQY